MEGCGEWCTICRPRPWPKPRLTEVEELRNRLRDMEIERNALRFALRLTLEKVSD